MSFGIVGAHRVGKTTLTELLSNETGLPFLETSVGSVFKQHGINPAEPMPFGKRIWIQEKVLEHCSAMWQAETGPFFTDRTPICMLGYTTADLVGHICLTDTEYAAYMEYRKKCFAAVHRFFGQLFILQPGIKIVDPGTKVTAALDAGYIEHLNSLMIGLSHSTECYTPVYTMPRKMTDLYMRCDAVVRAIEHGYNVQDRIMQGAAVH